MRYQLLSSFLALALFSAAGAPEARALEEVYRFEGRVSERRHVGAWERLREMLLGERPAENPDLTVMVRDADGNPLSGAAVLVGGRQGVPFAGNLASTGSDGRALFTDEALRQGKTFSVTASKSGYGTFTLAAPAAGDLEITLQEFATERDFAFLSGKLTGFPPGYDSSTLELGVFTPAFRPESLMNFDPQQFISSYIVKINVFGERDVPGNVVFPAQRKRYGLIPISIAKPEFIMPLPKGLEAHMGGIIGVVGISAALGAVQNKDFLGALNLAYLTHVGWTSRRVTVRGNEKFDVNAKEKIALDGLTAEFRGVPEGLDAVAVSVVDPENDRGDFVPTDVKAVKREAFRGGAASLKLGILERRSSSDGFYAFAGIFDRVALENKDATSRWIVGALQPVSRSRLTTRFDGFLKPIRSLGVRQSNREYRFSSPSSRGLKPDFVILNVVSEKKNSLTQGKTRNVLWSVVLPGDAESAVLPDLGRAVLPSPDRDRDEKFLWEVVAVKTQAKTGRGGLQSNLRNLEHVSSLSQNF